MIQANTAQVHISVSRRVQRLLAQWSGFHGPSATSVSFFKIPLTLLRVNVSGGALLALSHIYADVTVMAAGATVTGIMYTALGSAFLRMRISRCCAYVARRCRVS